MEDSDDVPKVCRELVESSFEDHREFVKSSPEAHRKIAESSLEDRWEFIRRSPRFHREYAGSSSEGSPRSSRRFIERKIDIPDKLPTLMVVRTLVELGSRGNLTNSVRGQLGP